MWKAAVGTNVQLNTAKNTDDDDWETDPDFINDVNEQEQRWGSTTIEGSGRTAGAIDMEKLRKETEEADALKKKKEQEEGPQASFGYGGKFGVEKDRMDKSALGHDHVEKLQKHASQKDYSTGFGGKFGVQTDRVDKSAVSWDHKEKLEKHSSQKDQSLGFGGKFGVQTDRQDKSAVGWDHVEKVNKHESQKDYSHGFGGKFGVQSDRQDKSAVGWDHHEAPQKHESQVDHKVGFGGKFGVQTDRMDKSAVAFDADPKNVGTAYDKVKPDIAGAKPSETRAKFETMGSQDTSSKQPALASSPAAKKNIQARVAALTASNSVEKTAESVPKQLDQSKLAFLNNSSNSSETAASTVPKAGPGHLDKSKFGQFEASNNETSNAPTNAINKVQQEIEELKKKAKEDGQVQEVVEAQTNDQIYDDVPQEEPTHYANIQQENTAVEVEEDEIVDTGFSAVALYDYQAGAEDEISFDPEDIITHVEMIDEGWWRGLCKGRYGLFPANYVQLQQ